MTGAENDVKRQKSVAIKVLSDACKVQPSTFRVTVKLTSWCLKMIKVGTAQIQKVVRVNPLIIVLHGNCLTNLNPSYAELRSANMWHTKHKSQILAAHSFYDLLFLVHNETTFTNSMCFCISLIIRKWYFSPPPLHQWLQQSSSGSRTVVEPWGLCCGNAIGSSAEVEQWRGGGVTARWPRFIFRILKCTKLLKQNIWRCKRERITEHYPPNYTMRRANPLLVSILHVKFSVPAAEPLAPSAPIGPAQPPHMQRSKLGTIRLRQNSS